MNGRQMTSDFRRHAQLGGMDDAFDRRRGFGAEQQIDRAAHNGGEDANAHEPTVNPASHEPTHVENAPTTARARNTRK